MFENDIVRLALSDRGETIVDFQLLDELIYIKVFHNDIMWQIIRDGIMINSEKYILYTSTTGQVRENTITLIKESFLNKHIGYLKLGLTISRINNHLNKFKREKGMNVGKYLSYNALPLSSSVVPEKEVDIDRCIVVNGFSSIINSDVKFIDIQTDKSGTCFVSDTPSKYQNKDIEIEHTDGAGMFLPGELNSSCQIRGGYFKGAMFPFDFAQFAKEIAHNSVIVDAWGNKVDIIKEDIRFILTTSQLKMWKEYDSWEEYKSLFKENKLQLSINSYANPAKELVTFSYQYLQTLPYTCDINKLCNAAKEDLYRLKADIEYVKEQMGFETDLVFDGEISSNEESLIGEIVSNTTDTKKSNSYIASALELYPPLIQDKYIQDKIRSLFNARRIGYMGGKIPIRGYYSYVVPDMYAFCEYLFMDNSIPKGLIPKNYIYNKYYDECRDVDNVICLRSPHLSRYEYAKRGLSKTDECRRWFKYMESDTVVSCHDLISKSLQCDWDGDEILISADKELYCLAEELPNEPLYYEMQKASPQIISNESIYKTLVSGFENNVIGQSSNAMTKLWNSPELRDNHLKYDDEINVFCAYSNYAIDFPKTGKNLELGKFEQLYKDLVPPKIGHEKFKAPKIKYPAFLKYAKGRKNNLEVSTPSPMDRISKYIGQNTGNLRYKYLDKNSNSSGVFDYRMLMNNSVSNDGSAKYEVNRQDSRYKELIVQLKLKKSSNKKACMEIENELRLHNTDSKDVVGRFDVFHYHCVEKIKELFSTKNGTFDVNRAVNYFIDMEYNKAEFASSSKDILWKCFGHIIIQNIINNQGKIITLKARPRMSYIKAIEGNPSLDTSIEEKTKKSSVVITKNDYDFIYNNLQRYKNGNLYSNDKELLFTLYCIYKEGKENKRLHNEYFVISKRKHKKIYSNGKKKTVNVKFNMNSIMIISGISSYNGSLQRFEKKEHIEIIQERNCIKVKFDIPSSSSDNKLFIIHDIYNSLVYLDAFENNKKLKTCSICGKDFIKSSNRQKTCSNKCKETLHKINQNAVNQRNRETTYLQKVI